MNRVTALLVLLALLALVACAAPTPAPQATVAVKAPTAPSVPTVAQPARGGTIVHGTYADAKVLNPHLTTDVPSSEIFTRVHEPLLDTDPTTGAPIPWLADKWDISADGLTYTFYLHKDVKWHDGKPFTAHDVKYTVEAILDPKTDSPRKSLFDQVKGAKDRQDKTKNVTDTAGVQVVDDLTIKFVLTEPYCPFLVSTMPALRVLPKHLYDGTDVNTNEYNKKPIGTGAWKFKEWLKDDHITLVANKDWWKQSGGPMLDTYIYKTVKDATVIMAQLKSGEMDMGGILPQDIPEVEKSSSLQLYKIPGLSYEYMGFNVTRVTDKKVRQAITYALDRAAIAQKAMGGLSPVRDSHLPPTSWAFKAGDFPVYKFDVAKAKSLLDEAGWKAGADGTRTDASGKPVTLHLWYNSGDTQREGTALIAQQQLKDVGLKVEIHSQEWNAYLDRLNNSRDYDMFLNAWILSPEFGPHTKNIFYTKGRFNRWVWSNEQVDKALDAALVVPGCKETDRAKYYQEFERIRAEELPNVALYDVVSLTVVNKKFQGVDPKPVGGLTWNFYQWSIKK